MVKAAGDAMNIRCVLAVSLALAGAAAQAQPSAPPGAPPVRPVVETLYGQKVVDPYRYMEQLGPETVGWMTAEGRYTRRLFDSMPGRARLGRELAAYTASLAPAQDYEAYGGRAFFEMRPPGSDNLAVMAREPGKVAKPLIDVAALRAAHDGAPFSIDFFEASPDGTKVAVEVSEGGSEISNLSVYDVATGRQTAGPIDRTHFGPPSWTADSAGLFVTRLQVTGDRAAKYANSTSSFWDLKRDPRPLLGAGLPGAIKLAPDQFLRVETTPGSAWARAVVYNGSSSDHELWIAPAADAATPGAPWRKVAGFDDNVRYMVQRGDDFFFLSHKDAPTFKVLHLRAGQPLAQADTVFAASPGRLVEGLEVASDGVYLEVREGLYSHLLRIPAAGGAAQDLPLPMHGSINDWFTDPRRPGVVVGIDNWITPTTYFSYAPNTGRFADLRLGPRPALNPNRFAVQELEATARDGVKAPLSYVAPRGVARPGIVLLFAYGAYGVAEFPYFSERSTFYLQQGVAVATCHPRGGGELGEAWRLGGKDATKPNTWRDLIACGDALIARGDATPRTLFIFGGSAGGVAIGRAMEERPDLFAGVIDAVPVANTLRNEFSPNGPANIPEFGTVKTEEGFHNLYAMDSYQHVEPGRRYPPILITAALNDARVDPWEPAKLAARMLAAGDPNPVLLRVEEAGGHGIDATKTQNDSLNADMLSFVLWQAGRPAFQPRP
jgi:prolyl oligopeptidase